jgi:AAA family ATP:ADP antiporter
MMADQLISRLRSRWQTINGPLSTRDLWATLWSSLGLGLLLFSYFLVRPIRELHGSRLGPAGLSRLFLMTFVALLVITPLWGMLVRFCSKRFLPVALMTVIAGSLVGFAQLLRNPDSPVWVSTSFFVWVSVFNYMMVSLYWSVMVDTFTPESGRRTFGIIAAGGSAGAMLGPLAASVLATRMSSSSTLLLAAGLFVVVPVFLFFVPRLPTTQEATVANARREEDSIISGLIETVNTPYLLGIAGYMLIGSLLGSLLYVHQSGAIQSAIPDEDLRRSFFANTDLAANILTLVFELVVAAPLLSYGGLRWPLLLLPLIGVLAAPLLTVWPSIYAIAAVLVVRRATEYGLAKPARELLFTVVTQSQKYKAKNFIDSVVARAGDSIGSSVSHLVVTQKWPPLVALWIGVPVSLLFAGIGVWLAREQNKRTTLQSSSASANSESVEIL